jgi:two-component system NarL family sensor kinase
MLYWSPNKTMKWIFLILLFLGAGADAQNRKIDNLNLRLHHSKEDTGRVTILVALGREYSYLIPDTALNYFRESLALSRKLNYERGQFYSDIYTGEVLATKGDYSKALEWELQALHIGSDLHDEGLIGDVNMHLGNLYYYQGNYRHSLDYYSKIRMLDKNDTDFEEALTGLKGRTFLALNQLDSAWRNSKRAYDIEIKRKPISWIVPAVTLASILAKEGKSDSALAIYMKYKDFEPGSKSNLEMTIPMSVLFIEKNEYDSAKLYLKRTVAYAIAKSYIEEASEASGLLSDIYRNEGNFDSAYTYLSINNSLKERLFNLNKDKGIVNEETDKKLYDKTIQSTQLQYENKVKIYGFGFAVIIFSVLTFLLWRNNQHRQRELFLLQKQKEDEKFKLQNEFQQALLQSQLEIQEQTFKNISMEIHDNIGQVLSLAKLNLATADFNKLETVREKIDDSRNLIAKSILDLRDLAKSLNTDYVQVMGLANSTAHELEIIKKTGSFETNFEIIGEPYKLEQQNELILFRIVQEALNNIMRHAKAKTIEVKLCYDPKFFSLTVHDDGMGFDISNLNQNRNNSRGLGIKNMSDRAQIIGAEIKIISEPGQGTTIDIKLPVSQLT